MGQKGISAPFPLFLTFFNEHLLYFKLESIVISKCMRITYTEKCFFSLTTLEIFLCLFLSVSSQRLLVNPAVKRSPLWTVLVTQISHENPFLPPHSPFNFLSFVSRATPEMRSFNCYSTPGFERAHRACLIICLSRWRG